MSLKVSKITVTDSQKAKFGDKPASKVRSAFQQGLSFTLVAIGWRQLLDDDNTPVLDKAGDEVVFPVLETSAGDDACISLGLFEPKWDEKLGQTVVPTGPLAEFFRANCASKTRLQLLTEMLEAFASKTFTTNLVFYSVATKDKKFFKASTPTFAEVEA